MSVIAKLLEWCVPGFRAPESLGTPAPQRHGGGGRTEYVGLSRIRSTEACQLSDVWAREAVWARQTGPNTIGSPFGSKR